MNNPHFQILEGHFNVISKLQMIFQFMASCFLTAVSLPMPQIRINQFAMDRRVEFPFSGIESPDGSRCLHASFFSHRTPFCIFDHSTLILWQRLFVPFSSLLVTSSSAFAPMVNSTQLLSEGLPYLP